MSLLLRSESGAEAPELPILQLRPARMEARAEGLESLVWPVTIAELASLRDRFLADFYAWCRDRDVDRDRNAELLWLNTAQIVVEVMRLFNGLAVQRRTTDRFRLTPTAGDESSLFHALAEGKAPAFSPVHFRTLSGIRPDPAWRKMLRLGKYAFNRNGLSYRPKSLLDPAKDIVTFSGGGLISAHAQVVGPRVVLSKFDEWMTVGALPTAAGIPPSREAVAAVLDLASQAFEAEGETLPEFLRTYLTEFLNQICGRSGFHLEELERHAKRLPRVFWSGTSGILFNRVMSRAVIKAGGTAVGHDHGTGTGWWQSYYQTVTELNYVDSFITYSDALAEGLRQNLRYDLLAHPERPRVVETIPRRHKAAGSPVPDAPVARASRASRPIRTIMYAPTIYAGEMMHLLPLLADPVAVDWQCRLLAFLRGEGYEVLVKPHPESYSPPPAAFAELFGVRFVEGPFESVMQEADLLLFDYLQTSCIVDAVRTDIPLVLVEFPRLAIRPEARELLGRRAALVPGWFDEAARAQVDWAAMRSAFATAPRLTDKRFADAYYPI